MDRRTLLQWLVATGGLAIAERMSPRDLESLGAEAHRQLQSGDGPAGVLTADEARTVAAIAERIIPRTDTPGATDAGVAPFVSLMLADWYPPADADRFRAGIAQFEASSTREFGGAFADAPEARQVSLVEALDAEVSALRRTNASAANAHWYGMLKFLTVWGYCTSEVAMKELFHAVPRPTKYDGAAPLG